MDMKQRVDLNKVLSSPSRGIGDEPPAYYTAELPSNSELKAFESSSREGGVQNDSRSCDQSSTGSPPPDFRSIPDTSSIDTILNPPPQLNGKLYTNYIPSMSEIGEIKQYVTKVHEKLTSYDDRIAELEAALQELSTKRSQLSEIASAHEALISPVRRLPPEILQTIFVFCLPSARNAVMHASEAPVLLGRICSEWRKISLATPEVWSSLHIVPPNVNFTNPASSSTRFQRKKEIIEMWLNRSGACPLSVSFVWFAGDSEDEINLCGMLLETLVPNCGRWKMLDFQVPLKMFKPFIGLTVNDVPLLEGLSLMDNRTPLDSDAIDRWPESLNFAESASNLRTFTLTFFSGGIRLPSIPWCQLTTLYLESNIAFFFSDSKEMLTAFSKCENLQSCTLKFPLSHTATLPAFEILDMPVTLPQLAVLCLDGDQHLHNTFHMSNTLMNLVTPKLRKLEILGRSGRPDGSLAPEPLSAVRMLLERSRCSLERMHIESITIVPEDFIACLKLTPGLVDLVVHNWAVRLPGPALPAATQDGGDENANVTTVEGATEGLEGWGVPIPRSSTSNSFRAKDVQIAENMILKALTIKRPVKSKKDAKRKQPSWSTDQPEASSSSSASGVDLGEEDSLICPRLRSFDFTLADASQSLLCDFVASRWVGIPEEGFLVEADSNDIPHDQLPSSSPVSPTSPHALRTTTQDPPNTTSSRILLTRLKSLKCNFTAYEEEGVKKKMQKFREEGLEALVTYQVPVSEDMNPSPWTGLDAPT